MSIQDWGAIGEIAGALAAFEHAVESSNHACEVLITNPEVANLFLKGPAESFD